MQEELDELNRLFTSKNADDVIKFYDHFDNAEQLIQWMKNRPSAPMKIYEVEGEKDIVIVIPTANHEGEYARNCANEIFKGQQIVFVESNGPFFNYARSCNFGLKYALKYNPKWLVLSNDDILEADTIGKLKKELLKLDHNKLVIALAVQDRRDRYSTRKRSTVYDLYEKFKGHSSYINLIQKYNVTYTPFSFSSNTTLRLKIRQIIIKIFTKKIFEIKFSGDFIIFSKKSILTIQDKYNQIFDETFINGCEDSEIFIKVLTENLKILTLNYKIKTDISGTLGKSTAKSYMGIANNCYFDFKFKKDYSELFNK